MNKNTNDLTESDLRKLDPVLFGLLPSGKQKNNVPKTYKRKTKLLFTNLMAPGDVVAMTAMIRDLHITYPGRFLTDVRTDYTELLLHNPYITHIEEYEADMFLHLQGGVIPENATPDSIEHAGDFFWRGSWHYIYSFMMEVNKRLGLQIHPTELKGDLYLSEEEEGLGEHCDQDKQLFDEIRNFAGDPPCYWIIAPGGKTDIPVKVWSHKKWQMVIDHFQGRIQFVQIGGNKSCHVNPRLNNVLNLVGKTSMRQLMRVMYHSLGVCCGLSLPMHMAAALPLKYNLNRPCVVVAGGRESLQTFAYPSQQHIHRIGFLPCCDRYGCGKWRLQPMGDGSSRDEPEHMCYFPILDSQPQQPLCMELIHPAEVIQKIELYHRYHLQKESLIYSMSEE